MTPAAASKAARSSRIGSASWIINGGVVHDKIVAGDEHLVGNDLSDEE